MSVKIQIRDVPESLRRRLKVHAMTAGLSLSEYFLNEMSKVAERPTLGELRKRLAGRSPVKIDVSSASAVRAIRGI